MLRVLARRIPFLVLVLFGVSIMTFALAHLVPTDPARLLAGPHATTAQIAQIRHRYGLDQPLPLQYLSYLGTLLHGDLGTSLHTQRPVGMDLSQFLPATLELSTAALVITIIFGIILGTMAAYWRNSWADTVISVLTITGSAMPSFWLGLLAQWLFYDVLSILPAGGRLDLGVNPPPQITGFYTIDSLLTGHLDLFVNALWHLLLPSIVLAFGSLGVVARMVRSSLCDALGMDYARTARAKGLTHLKVVVRHTLRNSLLPTITVIGLQTGYLLSGAILVETVFSWPGLGQYTAQSVLAADYTPILGVTLVVALLYVILNTVVDLVYAAADPRVHYS